MLRNFKLALAGFLFAALTPLLAAAADAPSTSELLDRAAIQNLVVKYTIALDTLDADMYASVFAEDAEFTFGGNTYKGRDAIRKIVTGLQERRKGPNRRAEVVPRSLQHLRRVRERHEAHHRSYWQTIIGAVERSVQRRRHGALRGHAREARRAVADPEAPDHPIAVRRPVDRPPPPAQIVGDLAKAHIAARCLHVAAMFGVADAVGDAPTTPAEIGARTGLDPDAADRILRSARRARRVHGGADGLLAQRGVAAVAQRSSAVAAQLCADDGHAVVLEPVHGARHRREDRPAVGRLARAARLLRAASGRGRALQRGDGREIARRAARGRGRATTSAASRRSPTSAAAAAICSRRCSSARREASGILFDLPQVVAETRSGAAARRRASRRRRRFLQGPAARGRRLSSDGL